MPALDQFLQRIHPAYFSMEIALRPEIHTCSGGLGVLAGDTARSYADLEMLERVIPQLYHGDRARWVWMTKQAISKIASYFNSQRMMRRYASEAYFR